MTPVRLAAFVSHYLGDAVLAALLRMKEVEVVLVATDDPLNPVCNPDGRLWRYSKSTELASLVPRRAARAGLTAFTGSITSPEFELLFQQAAPQAILSSFFGQKIPKARLLDVDRRAWNMHPVAPGRPLQDTRGVDPIDQARKLGASAIETCLHVMTERFDDGEEVGRSFPCSLPDVDQLTPELHLMIHASQAVIQVELIER